MIKVNYNAQSGQILGFYPDCIAYEYIPEPFIEITEGQRDEISNKDFIRIINEEITDISTTEEYRFLESQKQKELNKQILQNEIDAIDKKRIRAICEPSFKEDGVSWLEYYNSQIQAKRQEIIDLG